MKSDRNLIEYLYVDVPRIERYFQQLSSPVKYDKIPIWKVALSLTGTSAETSQSRPGREFTEHEKIEKVVESIEADRLVANFRTPFGMLWENDISYEVPFVRETITARRVQIEWAEHRLNLWVSLSAKQKSAVGYRHPSSALYLIEDFRGNDDHTNCCSGYSSLYLLVGELSENQRFLLSKDSDSSPLEALTRRDEAARQFASDPIGTLISIGGVFGPERRIKVLYRFRASCIEKDDVVGTQTVVGYPLFIHAA